MVKLWEKLRSIFYSRSVKFWWQRRTRGWDDSETWSLDITVAKFMLPRLKRFRELKVGYPSNMSQERWEYILGEMEWFLEVHAEFHSVYDVNRYAKAAKIFGDYFGSLWW